MERICRICLISETTTEFTEIFSKLSQKIALKIFLISHVKIIERVNECPALICSQCFKELHQCVQFRKKIQTSDEYFRNKLEKYENDLWKLESDDGDIDVDGVGEEDDSQLDDEIKIEALDDDFEYEALDEVEDIQQQENSQNSENNENFKINETSEEKKKGEKRAYNRLTCKICGVTLSRRLRLIQHERLHFLDLTKSFYECDMCDKKFNQRFSLIPHFQKHHNFKLGAKERWKCAICKNKSLPAAKMEVHYRKFHSEFYGDSPRQDLNIQQMTPKKALKNTQKAQKAHKKEKSKNWFLCGICGNSFISSYRYHKHLNDIHGVTEHELDNPSTDASDHQKIKKSKNVPCQLCGKVYSSVITCKAHEKTHLNVRYVCDLCGSDFKVKVIQINFNYFRNLKIKFKFKLRLISQHMFRKFIYD